MKSKVILGILMLGFSLLSLKSQEQKSGFDVEKHRQERADFFIKELGLTEKEQKEFIPLMNDYFFARYQLSKSLRDVARELKGKQDKSKLDEKRQHAIDLIVATKIKEAELQKEYYQKFGKVLSPEKILKYHKAEMDFMQQAVKQHHHQERKREQGEN